MATDSFSLTLHWQEGSVPPPYYYEYRVNISHSGAGQIVLNLGYSSDPPRSWTEAFQLSEQDIARLHEATKNPPPAAQTPSASGVGGSHTMVSIGTKQETILRSDANPASKEWIDRVRSVVDALIPKTVWQRLMKHRTEFMNRYEEGKRSP